MRHSAPLPCRTDRGFAPAVRGQVRDGSSVVLINLVAFSAIAASLLAGLSVIA